MDIERIREFIVLASTCSYSMASDALFTTNSTLSKHIAQIEKELGHQLFDRTTRRVSLSREGSLFLENAKQIVELYDRSMNAMHALAAENNNSLTVAFLQVMRQYQVLGLINEFSAFYPQYEAHLLEAEGQSMNALLHSKACDFAFASRLDLFERDVAYEPYATDDLVLVVPKRHRLSKVGIVDINELRNETFVLHNSYYEKTEFLSECRRYGFEVQSILTSSSESIVMDVVSNSNAITVFSRARYLSVVNPARFSMVEISPRISFNVYLLYLKNKKLNPSQDSFVRFVRRKCEESLLEKE